MLKGTLRITGNTYYACFRTKGVNDSKAKQHNISTGIKAIKGNKRKAEERMAEIISEYESNSRKLSDSPLLENYVNEWLSDRKPELSVTTYDNYVHSCNKHIFPYFSGKRLCDITSDDIEEYYKIKIREGLSPNTVIKHGTLLGTVFKKAKKKKLISINPVEDADKPKRIKPKHDCFTVAELRELWKRAQGINIEVPLYLAIFYGLRRSEILGVRWSAINFTKRTLTINKTVVNSREEHTIIARDETKTEDSLRVYELNDEHIAYLKRIKAQQDSMLRVTDKYVDYLCVNEVGELFKPDYLTEKFNKLLDEFGMKHIRLHDLRHSCLSAVANDPGFTMKQVQVYAGHANYQITADTYSHVDISEKKRVLDALTTAIFF